MCAHEQLRPYHSPEELSWDEWRLSNREVDRFDLEKAGNPDEADGLEGYLRQPGSPCQLFNPIFPSYLVDNNEGQLLTRAETLSQRKKKT